MLKIGISTKMTNYNSIKMVILPHKICILTKIKIPSIHLFKKICYNIFLYQNKLEYICHEIVCIEISY